MARDADGFGLVMAACSAGSLAPGGDGTRSVAAAGLCPLRSRSMRLPDACLPLEALIQVQLMLRRRQLSQGFS